MQNNFFGRQLPAFGLSLALAATGVQAFAQSSATEFVPFNNFIQHIQTAVASEFMASADSKLKQTSAFEEMRASILSRYQGMPVTHSFVLDGNHYDCVPVNQQPATRTYGVTQIAVAPPQSLLAHQLAAPGGTIKQATVTDLDKGTDIAGNSLSCEAGTVPLLRTTLETMSRFATLQDFYHKAQGGAVKAAQSPEFLDPSVAAHKYSFTYQYVNNLGGNSNLNVWSPPVNTSAGEVFSLSQEWYIGGSGSGTQTEEVGLVVYPAMFGDEKSHFFIFSTADDYATGCWNNSCGDFVQVAGNGLLGNSFSNYSTFQGAQYEITAEYYLYQGNWWLGFGGTWIGYYPGSKYHGGQNTKYAQLIEFGSEGVGTTIWPPEGSGDWSNAGYTRAAYQRNLWYINTSAVSYWDTLTADQPSPLDYTISGPYSSSSAWTRYFYEGGPGGTH